MLQRTLRSVLSFSVQVFATACIVVFLLGFLESSSSSAGPTGCEDDVRLFSADTNGDGTIDISDPIWLLAYLFESGPPPFCLAQSPSPLDDFYVNEGQLHSITSGMIVNRTILPNDLAFDPATQAELDAVPILSPEQEEILGHLSIVYLDDGQGGQAKTIRVQGVNVQIVNGLGATNGYPSNTDSEVNAVVNGVGNLIVGYNDVRTGVGQVGNRTGSHNIVVGSKHNYTEFGGVVAGRFGTISGPWANVLGGNGNTASGRHSTVTGGDGNVACGIKATVVGGRNNDAEGEWSVVVSGRDNRTIGGKSVVLGGLANTATGSESSVTGGQGNLASGNHANVCGGRNNEASGEAATVGGGGTPDGSTPGNVASGDYSYIAGGRANVASQIRASVFGGQVNTASAFQATVVGGTNNSANGNNATVTGGDFNTASGENSSVSGGQNRSASGQYDWAAGSLFEDD